MTGTERKRVVATTHHLRRAELQHQRSLDRGRTPSPSWSWVAVKGAVVLVLAAVALRMVWTLRPLPPPQAVSAVASLPAAAVPPSAPATTPPLAPTTLPASDASAVASTPAPERPAPEPAADAHPAHAFPDCNAMFKAIMDRHLARLRPPMPGKAYAVALSNGTTVTGVLASADADTVVLDVEHGLLKLRRKDVHRKSWPDLFPRHAARIIARHELTQTMLAGDACSGSAGKKAAREALAGVESDANSRVPWTAVAGKFPFAPEVLQAWLKAAGRAAGVPVASRMQVQRDHDSLVLWLTVTDPFLMLEPERQTHLAADLEEFWGSQCQATGCLGSATQAVVILVDASNTAIAGNTAKALQMTACRNGSGLRPPVTAAVLEEDPGT